MEIWPSVISLRTIGYGPTEVINFYPRLPKQLLKVVSKCKLSKWTLKYLCLANLNPLDIKVFGTQIEYWGEGGLA